MGWTHNLVILEKCKDDLEREFYIRMTKKFGDFLELADEYSERQLEQAILARVEPFLK